MKRYEGRCTRTGCSQPMAVEIDSEKRHEYRYCKKCGLMVVLQPVAPQEVPVVQLNPRTICADCGGTLKWRWKGRRMACESCEARGA